MAKLSILTVVKDDPKGLQETYESIKLHTKISYEHVIWLHPSSVDAYNLSDIKNDKNVKFYMGKDFGIFDAMNKAIEKASGDFVIFLNAGDKFISNLEDMPTEPSLIEVYYPDFRNVYRKVRKRKSIKFGIPYCHQGMVFENKELQFVEQSFASDYILFLKHFQNWPNVNFISGKVHYNNDGVSTINRLASDKMTATVIKNEFGLIYSLLYLTKSYIKICIKSLYKITKK